MLDVFMNQVSQSGNTTILMSQWIAENFNLGWLLRYYPMYIDGAKNTLLIAFFTVFMASLLGAVLAIMRISKHKILKSIAAVYIEFIRGTPLYVQILVFYYGFATIGIEFPNVPFLTPILGMNVNDFSACIFTLSINSAAYVAEIMRAGILAVDKGQMEAARSLGMPQKLAMREIILPQAVKNILPALGNEFVTIIKESSIVAVIGIADLMFKARLISSNTSKPFGPYIVVSLIYFVLTFGLSNIIRYFERRLNASDSR